MAFSDPYSCFYLKLPAFPQLNCVNNLLYTCICYGILNFGFNDVSFLVLVLRYLVVSAVVIQLI